MSEINKMIEWVEDYPGSLKIGDRIHRGDAVYKIKYKHFNFINVTYRAYRDLEFENSMKKI